MASEATSTTAPSSTTIPLVLVTGVTGFIGAHVANYALKAGYRVRGTVRSLANAKKLEGIRGLTGPTGHMELVECDLTAPTGWDAAMEGVTFLIHVASPVPIGAVRDDEKEIIQPALKGLQFAVRAAIKSPTVRRVVMTSSVAAIFEGHPDADHKVFTEADWSNFEGIGSYSRSKLLAEREAWRIMREEVPAGRQIDLATINPGFVVGPPLSHVLSSTLELPHRLLNYEMPAVPDLRLGGVDVRDVALAHLRAMVIPAAGGHRFMLVAPGAPVMFPVVARDVAAEFGRYNYSVPTMVAPYFFLWLKSWFDKPLALLLPFVGKQFRCDSSAASTVLQLHWRDLTTSVREMCYACIAQGIVPDKTKDKSLSTGEIGQRVRSETATVPEADLTGVDISPAGAARGVLAALPAPPLTPPALPASASATAAATTAGASSTGAGASFTGSSASSATNTSAPSSAVTAAPAGSSDAPAGAGAGSETSATATVSTTTTTTSSAPST